jgi:DNA-binding NarL/FixJ family response regulator
MMSGPLQVIAASFELGTDFERRVVAEVDRLQGRGVLRLLDVLVVAKTDDGTLERMAVEDFGSLLGGLLPADADGQRRGAVDTGSPGFQLSDVWALAEPLRPGTAIAFLLVEHAWARPLLDAFAETGGALLGEGFLTSEAGLLVEAELAAIDEAAEVIAAAQEDEARAILAVIAAEGRAAKAVEAATVIRAAAVAEAVSALITAGLIKESAAHEAIDAMRVAGLLVAAVDKIGAEAVAEGAAVVRAASITLAQANVLRYLPTTLSFADIAHKLSISRGAAKQRAERAYKKLGVHSRAEAVTRARDLHLIA